ncbi:MAG TPA: FAD-binding oxidoreductase [Gemmatimonadales bacterium]|nr:FAD-binding oxidoreductase [Gemmatimonadales bacterium]
MTEDPALQGIFRTDLRARAAYAEGAGIYRIVPSAVALPAGREDLTRLVQWARRTGTSLIPRGAGSGMCGANVGSGVVVDLSSLPGVLEIDRAERRARVSPSITAGQLNQRAAEHGLRLPPDPSSATWATLGGMVSTNAAGPLSLRYGSMRPWVHALEVVTDDGAIGRTVRGSKDGPELPAAFQRFAREVAPVLRNSADLIRQHFPRTRKNSSGFALDAWLQSDDTVDLWVGAEGTLGFISELEIRLDPSPAARAVLQIALGDLDELGQVVTSLLGLQPSAIELLDRTFLDLVAEAAGREGLRHVPAATQAVLVVDFERDNPTAVRGAVGDAARVAGPWALDLVTALDADEERRLRALRAAASPIVAGLSERRRSMQVIEDGCVPLERLGTYIRFIRQAAHARGLQVVIFGHAGDGNVHVNLLPDLDRAGWRTEVLALQEEVMAEVIRLGGTVSGEHGDGRLRARFLEQQYGAEVVALFRRVKTAFDPDGIFNPGVILPEAEPPLARLKMGSDAAELPSDIGRALREIERTGGYARSRLSLADAPPDDGGAARPA